MPSVVIAWPHRDVERTKKNRGNTKSSPRLRARLITCYTLRMRGNILRAKRAATKTTSGAELDFETDLSDELPGVKESLFCWCAHFQSPLEV